MRIAAVILYLFSALVCMGQSPSFKSFKLSDFTTNGLVIGGKHSTNADTLVGPNLKTPTNSPISGQIVVATGNGGDTAWSAQAAPGSATNGIATLNGIGTNTTIVTQLTVSGNESVTGTLHAAGSIDTDNDLTSGGIVMAGNDVVAVGDIQGGGQLSGSTLSITNGSSFYNPITNSSIPTNRLVFTALSSNFDGAIIGSGLSFNPATKTLTATGGGGGSPSGTNLITYSNTVISGDFALRQLYNASATMVMDWSDLFVNIPGTLHLGNDLTSTANASFGGSVSALGIIDNTGTPGSFVKYSAGNQLIAGSIDVGVLPQNVPTNVWVGVSDNSTDNSASLNAFLASAKSVRIVAGTNYYRFTSPIVTSNDCEIWQDVGANLYWAGTGPLINSYANSNRLRLHGVHAIGNSNSVPFRTATVGGNNSAVLGWAKGFLAENCSFRDFATNAIALESDDDLNGQSNRYWVVNCYFSNNWSGIQLNGVTNVEWGIIQGNDFFNCHHALELFDAPNNNIIGNLGHCLNQFMRNTGTIQASSSQRAHCDVIGNWIAHIDNAVFAWTNCNGGVIADNPAIARVAGAADMIFSGCSIVEVKGNTFYNAPVIVTAGTQGSSGANLFVDNTTVSATGAAGTWTGPTNLWTIERNITRNGLNMFSTPVGTSLFNEPIVTTNSFNTVIPITVNNAGTNFSLVLNGSNNVQILTVASNGLTTIPFGGLILGSGAVAVTNRLAASATLDFPSTLATANSDLSITLAGASDGDPVTLAVPSGSMAQGGVFQAFSSNGAVWVRFQAGVAVADPASGTFKVTVLKY